MGFFPSPIISPNTNFYNTFGVYKNTNFHCICTTFVNYHRLTFLCKTVLFSCVSCTDSVSGAEDISVQDILCGRHFCSGKIVWKTFLCRQNCAEDKSNECVKWKFCGRHLCIMICLVHGRKFMWKTNRTSVWKWKLCEDICVSCFVSCMYVCEKKETKIRKKK